MLPRTKSIFHIGDDNGEETINEQEKEALISINNSDSEKKAVGLRLIIENSPIDKSVVTKWAMNLLKSKEFGFLKTCFFCHKELSSQKDVFIYKGEQTFCSIECRGQKIRLDRRRELETYMMRQRGKLHKNYNKESNISGLNRHKILTLAT
ncbi:hypothetical protein LUZ60_005668 [Juncus effusus]|nr:hypothetical protein LUZ60_005668 [Juncus effusus]